MVIIQWLWCNDDGAVMVEQQLHFIKNICKFNLIWFGLYQSSGGAMVQASDFHAESMGSNGDYAVKTCPWAEHFDDDDDDDDDDE